MKKSVYALVGRFVVRVRHGHGLWKSGEAFEEIASEPLLEDDVAILSNDVEEMLRAYMPEDTDITRWECVGHRIIKLTPKVFKDLKKSIKFWYETGDLEESKSETHDERLWELAYSLLPEYHDR